MFLVDVLPYPYIARYPDDHVTVIVLGNMDAANTSGIGDYLASLVFGS